MCIAKQGAKLPADTEGDVRGSDATEQNSAYVDCQNIAEPGPHTFTVLALLILILSRVMISRTPTDIFPTRQSRRRWMGYVAIAKILTNSSGEAKHG